jgi:hypothetical protein
VALVIWLFVLARIGKKNDRSYEERLAQTLKKEKK